MTDLTHLDQPSTPARAQRVLVLQGGGALGSYQAGAFQALCHHGFEPEWVAGISIGAINAAIIAGNGPEKRVDRLKEFWQMASTPVPWQPLGKGDRFSMRQVRQLSRPSGFPASSRRGFRHRRCGRLTIRNSSATTTPRR